MDLGLHVKHGRVRWHVDCDGSAVEVFHEKRYGRCGKVERGGRISGRDKTYEAWKRERYEIRMTYQRKCACMCVLRVCACVCV